MRLLDGRLTFKINSSCHLSFFNIYKWLYLFRFVQLGRQINILSYWSWSLFQYQPSDNVTSSLHHRTLVVRSFFGVNIRRPNSNEDVHEVPELIPFLSYFFILVSVPFYDSFVKSLAKEKYQIYHTALSHCSNPHIQSLSSRLQSSKPAELSVPPTILSRLISYINFQSAVSLLPLFTSNRFYYLSYIAIG